MEQQQTQQLVDDSTVKEKVSTIEIRTAVSAKKIPGQRTDQLICLSDSKFNTRNKMPQELLTDINIKWERGEN